MVSPNVIRDENNEKIEDVYERLTKRWEEVILTHIRKDIYENVGEKGSDREREQLIAKQGMLMIFMNVKV